MMERKGSRRRASKSAPIKSQRHAAPSKLQQYARVFTFVVALLLISWVPSLLSTPGPAATNDDQLAPVMPARKLSHAQLKSVLGEIQAAVSLHQSSPEAAVKALEGIGRRHDHDAAVHGLLASAFSTIENPSHGSSGSMRHAQRQLSLLKGTLSALSAQHAPASEQDRVKKEVADAHYTIAATLMMTKGPRSKISEHLQEVVDLNSAHPTARHWLALQVRFHVVCTNTCYLWLHPPNVEHRSRQILVS